MNIFCHLSDKCLERDRTYCCRKVVNYSNGDAGITRPTADWYRQRIADKGLKPPLAANVHKVLATITTNL